MEAEERVERKLLREWREEAGLLQRELAELAACGQTTVAMIERGVISMDGAAGQRLAEVLGVELSQIVAPTVAEEEFHWEEDGFDPYAPRRTLRDWRQARGMSIRELGILARVPPSTISGIENEARHGGKTKAVTRRRLVSALRVHSSKITFPGTGAKPTEEEPLEVQLRAELRGARRALKRSYDFLREDPNIAFRALEKRDALLGDVEKELRGT